MKREQKRYFLVEYYTARNYIYDSLEEIENVLDEIRKYNERKTEQFIIGNMYINKIDDKYVLSAHIYNKLENRQTISDIDNFTSKMDEHELIIHYRDKLKRIYEIGEIPAYYPDINIAYFEDKDADKNDKNIIRNINYIPVLYKDSTQYMNREYVNNCLYNHANNNDFGFFKALIEKFNYSHVIADNLDELERTIDQVKYQGLSNLELYESAKRIYSNLIYEREKDGSISRDASGNYLISRRRLRDFGFFVKNYNSSKEKIPTKYSYSVSKARIEELKRIRAEIDRIRSEEKINPQVLKKKKK